MAINGSIEVPTWGLKLGELEKVTKRNIEFYTLETQFNYELNKWIEDNITNYTNLKFYLKVGNNSLYIKKEIGETNFDPTNVYDIFTINDLEKIWNSTRNSFSKDSYELISIDNNGLEKSVANLFIRFIFKENNLIPPVPPIPPETGWERMLSYSINFSGPTDGGNTSIKPSSFNKKTGWSYRVLLYKDGILIKTGSTYKPYITFDFSIEGRRFEASDNYSGGYLFFTWTKTTSTDKDFYGYQYVVEQKDFRKKEVNYESYTSN